MKCRVHHSTYDVIARVLAGARQSSVIIQLVQMITSSVVRGLGRSRCTVYTQAGFQGLRQSAGQCVRALYQVWGIIWAQTIGSWSIAFIEYHIVIMAMLTRVTMVIILPRRAVQGQQL